MKKILILLAVFTLVGCTSNKTPSLTEQEKLMKEYAFRVFEEEIKKDLDTQRGMEIREIRIETLKTLNDYGRVYDLTLLSNCTDSSSVSLMIDEDAKEITDYEINLNCKQN